MRVVAPLLLLVAVLAGAEETWPDVVERKIDLPDGAYALPEIITMGTREAGIPVEVDLDVRPTEPSELSTPGVGRARISYGHFLMLTVRRYDYLVFTDRIRIVPSGSGRERAAATGAVGVIYHDGERGRRRLIAPGP